MVLRVSGIIMYRHIISKNAFSETFWGINSSVPLYILVIFGLCMVRDPTFFARFSAFGTVTVILILFTAFYKVTHLTYEVFPPI